MEQFLMGSLLGINTILDIRKREISLVSIIIYGIVGIVMLFIEKSTSLSSTVGGLLIGIGIMILNKLTKDGIGIGDGYIVMITGIYLGFQRNAALILYAMLLAAGYSVFLLTIKKVDKKEKIPFVPFLFLSYLIGNCIL